MAFDRKQFRSFVEKVLKDNDLYSESAVEILLGTAAQESSFGTYLWQGGGGPARGVFQIEPNTEKDLFENYLKYKPELLAKVNSVLHPRSLSFEPLIYNLVYQTLMARIFYLRIKEPLPAKDNIREMARYYKKYYNTYLGKATEEEFVHNYIKYVRPELKGKI